MSPSVQEFEREVSTPDSSFAVSSADSPTPSDINLFSSLSSDSDSGVQPDLTTDVFEHIRIPLEQNLQELLKKVTGKDDLGTVTEVKLRVITREVSLQHLSIHTPALQKLILDGSIVSSLRDLGSGLKNLKILHVNQCSLTSLDGIFGLESLEEFYIANNSITDACNCAFLPEIKIIDLRYNRLEDVKSLSFLAMCEKLEQLSIEGNEEITKIPKYRKIIKGLLPGLKLLDNISIKEDKFMEEYGDSNEKEDDFSCDVDSSVLPDSSHSSMKQSFLPPIHTSQGQISRPSSSGTNEKFSQNSNRRPMTSRSASMKNDKSEKTELPEIFKNNEGEKPVPSLLTSGLPVCGNVAVAIRNRKKMKEAWSDKKQN